MKDIALSIADGVHGFLAYSRCGVDKGGIAFRESIEDARYFLG
jgi:hypothetical protein